jgi:hypothetical protein
LPVAGFKKWRCTHAGQVTAVTEGPFRIVGWRFAGTRACTCLPSGRKVPFRKGIVLIEINYLELPLATIF